MTQIAYEGDELRLFQDARRWKAYFSREMRAFIRGRVLEVGAGIGGTTRLFMDAPFESWLCIDPDREHVAQLRSLVASGELPSRCLVEEGTLEDLGNGAGTFDTILYIDVLEHIADDRAELRDASERLAPHGHVLVLSPAHPWLYSPFDRKIGHHRRYTKASLAALAPDDLALVRLAYLDTAGLLASFANRALLRSADPTRAQIRFWDDVLVRASERIDRVLAYRLGKSVLGVWEKR